MNRFFASVLLVVVGAACLDQVQSDEEAAQGGETPGIAPGPRHRAGQNCTACHGPVGGEGPEISVGGTVYKSRLSDEPAVDATVFIVDANKDVRKFTTNDVGNFHAPKESWDPVFPLKIVVEYGACREEMFSLSRRDGGCGKCHEKKEDGTREKMPRIYALKEGCEAPRGEP